MLDIADGIEADLNYAIDTGVVSVTETLPDGTNVHPVASTYVPQRVHIRDLRAARDRITLEENGFLLVDHPTRVRDFYNVQELTDIYYPEMIELVKKTSGARRVVVFDHTLRNGDEAARIERKVRKPVTGVHNDYSEWSAPQRVRDIMKDEAEALLANRFAVIQIWRPINVPALRDPLAFADGASVASEDFFVSERRYPDRVGQTMRVKFNPAHRWYYVPAMRPNEAVVFKVYDSARDGRARFTAHSAFKDPNTPADAPPRESIEIRTLAFF
jgi:hypothetical protein